MFQHQTARLKSAPGDGSLEDRSRECAPPRARVDGHSASRSLLRPRRTASTRTSAASRSTSTSQRSAPAEPLGRPRLRGRPLRHGAPRRAAGVRRRTTTPPESRGAQWPVPAKGRARRFWREKLTGVCSADRCLAPRCGLGLCTGTKPSGDERSSAAFGRRS